MKDLAICVLTCSKEKTRLKNFLKFGLLNKNKDLKIVFLSDEEKPEFVDMECEWKNYKETHYSLRFSKYLIDEKNEYKWYLQVDDDSSTDIENFIKTIKKSYDHKDPIMLKTPILTKIKSNKEETVLASNNLEESLKKTFEELEFEIKENEFEHTWEITGISNEGVEKIKKYEQKEKFLRLCKKNKTTFGDQVPFALAKLAKIPAVSFAKFSPFPIASEFTALNEKGKYCHIHYVMEEWDEFENFKNLVEKKFKTDNTELLDKEIKNKDLKKTFWEVLEKKSESTFVIFLDKNEILKVPLPLKKSWGDKNIKWKFLNNEIEISNENSKMKLSPNSNNYFENENYLMKKIDFIKVLGNKINSTFDFS